GPALRGGRAARRPGGGRRERWPAGRRRLRGWLSVGGGGSRCQRGARQAGGLESRWDPQVPVPGDAPITRPLNVALADDELDTREYLHDLLTRLGHRGYPVEDGRRLVELCRAAPPDLIIPDIKMPGMDGIEAVQKVCRERPAPVVLVSAFHDEELLARAREGCVMAYLTKPVRPADVEAAVAVAVSRFEVLQRARQETAGLRQALEDRKVVEQAKGAVMCRLGLAEAEAFRRLKRLAGAHNRKVVEVAQVILRAEDVFRSLEQH